MEEEMKKKRQIGRKILSHLVYTLAILIVLGVLVWVVWNHIATRNLCREIDKIRAAGEPLTFKDLVEGIPKIEEKDNAGRYYAAALELLDEEESNKVHEEFIDNYIHAPEKDRDKKILDQAGKFLQENEEVINLLDKAAEMPACQLDIKILGVGITNTRCQGRIKAMARLQSVRSLYLAETGKGDKAIDSLVSELRMGRIFKNQPELTTALIQIGCTSIACSDIQQVLKRCLPTEKALIRIEAALKEQEQLQRPAQMMIEERVYTIATQVLALPLKIKKQILEDNAEFDVQPFWAWPTSSITPWARQILAGYLHDMAGFIELLNKPWPEVLRISRKYAYEIESWMGKMTIRSLVRAISIYGSATAKVRCTRTAVAVERFRRVNGRVPKSLDELVPRFIEKVPMDPFSGKELLYKLDDDSYTIYSVNENMKDDNGDIIVPGSCADRQFLDRGIRIRFSDQ